MIQYVGWTIAACVLGFAVTGIFSGLLRWSRSVLLVPYVLVVVVFLAAYVRWAGLEVIEILTHNLVWGVVAGALVSVLLVRNVLGQPGGERPRGARLAFDLVWAGLVYGAIDGLFLSVFPVLVSWESFPELRATPVGVVAVGALAIVSSAAVTASYHAGYAEFRGPKMRLALAGNSIITLGYLVSANPIAAFGSHAVMHVAAVLHGAEGTAQLPPHYDVAPHAAAAA